tara:strand:- start:444 stop:1352 length:909 start_codon:yes stop_codon:yes gene_type:complete
MRIDITIIVFLFIYSFSSILFSQDRVPFATKKLIKEYQDYESDIRNKASQLIEKKKVETIAALEKQSAALSRSGNAEMARSVLEMASSLSEGKEMSEGLSGLDNVSDQTAKSKWVNLFSSDDLPKSWIIPEDPDGGWDYKNGVFIMKCLFDDSVALHDAPEGDLVVRLKVKIVDNENKENDAERKHAGFGFINSKDSLVMGYVSLEGNVYGYTNINPAVDLGYIKSGIREGKFFEVQLAWVGTYFLMFVDDKLLIKSDIGIERGTAKISLLGENCFSSFASAQHMKPSLEDLKRLASGKPLE